MALPDTCLACIMTCLADTLEPGGLRGPSAVAADLARAAEVRREAECAPVWHLGGARPSMVGVQGLWQGNV